MPHICVIVCTCDRPALLADLLSSLIPQVAALNASLVITDNGKSSSENVVQSHMPVLPIRYVRFLERGLVAARNAGLREAVRAAPEFIAFIDDDEVPQANWLANLAACLEETGADIACGPYDPEFLAPPPFWARNGFFFSKNGSSIATGNLMFRASILPAEESNWFQPAFNFIGGEDEEFFQRLIAGGAKFAVASNARVSERVPPSRLHVSYILRTGLRDGIIETALMRRRGQGAGATLAHIGKKLGYAANHLFWSWREPWRLVAAARDAAEAWGTILGQTNVSGKFYGS